MAYGGGAVSGKQGNQGFREIVPRCKPGPDFEACRRDLLIEGAGLMLWVVATLAVTGVACWLVLSGKWSLMLIKLEQKIRSLRR